MTAPKLAQQDKDGKRVYKNPRSQETVPSVTTIISAGVPKPLLVPWAAKMAAEHATANWLRLSKLPHTERIDEIKNAHRVYTEKAQNVGNIVHKLIECWSTGEPYPEWPKEVEHFVDQFITFMTIKRPEFIENEVTVWNRTEGYAGTADFIAKIDGKLILGDVKGLALETPLPTPDGWTTMGAVRIGDLLFDRNGIPCRVIEKSPIHLKHCFRVSFDDGTSIICDHDHRWITESGKWKRRVRSVFTTEEIAKNLVDKYGQHHQRVSVAAPLVLPERKLPISPYVLGCWLGDGKCASGEISGADSYIFDEIARCGYEVGPNINHKPGGCPSHTIYGLRRQLRLSGILGNKHIPDGYLRGSVEERKALLQGLMDTDGTWNKTRLSATFTSIDKSLAYAVRELALSLGQRVTCHAVDGMGFGKSVTSWRVTFTPNGINPFRLPRKSSQVPGVSVRASRRVIVSVEPTVTVRTQCISVDSPDHTYLCGDTMIPTHNTGRNLYPEVGLQLSALAHAEFIIRHDGTEEPLPKIDRLAALHVRPRSWKLVYTEYPEECYTAFLHAKGIMEWERRIAPRVLGEGK